MAINPMTMIQLKGRLDLFNQDHPRVMPFLNMLTGLKLQEGTVLELKVTEPDGKDYVTNIRLNQNDLETIELLKKQR